jgi:hypothetical protein
MWEPSSFLVKALGRFLGLACLIIAIVLIVNIVLYFRNKIVIRIVVLIGGPLFALTMGLAYRVYTFGQRLSIREAAAVLEMDHRAPILLLRSFLDDHARVVNSDRILPHEWIFGGRRLRSFEEALVAKLSAYGPVLAIGRPGEAVPPLGAARMWVNHLEWQEKVEELLHRCHFVVMIVGELKGKDGLAWEVLRLLSLHDRGKIILLAPPLAEEEVERRWLVYHEVSRGLIPAYQGGEVAARLGEGGTCHVVRFGCRQDGDYLVALGDLIGPAPGPAATQKPVDQFMGRIREFLESLMEEDPDRALMVMGGIFHRSAEDQPQAWVDRLAWQLGALRLAAEIHDDEFTPERRDRIQRALHEAEESSVRCVQFQDSARDGWSEKLFDERQTLLTRLEEARASIREGNQPRNAAN